MSISQAVEDLARRVRELKPIIETEEATKTAFIIPFISNVLGYDVTDPREVIPEYTADIGVKKGEKVDFAIKSGEDFRFLIECKKIGEPLNLNHANQLIRYFNVTDTEFAILTNGEVYEFYTQLDAINRMDEKPFMTLNLSSIDARIFPHLDMCTKPHFDSDTLTASAEQLKYISEIKKVLTAQFSTPDTDWVKHLVARVTARRLTAQTLEAFSDLVLSAQSQFLKDEANRRLRSAQDLDESIREPVVIEAEAVTEEDDNSGIVTTEEEFEAFDIIRAICCAEVPVEDITMRDAKTYCAILYQDNNRKPIARLYFDRQIPRIGIFDAERKEHFFDLSSVPDIYSHIDLLRERCRALKG
ncbi:type I restriction enzyme HsdR N-terminal domain-containing protein [Corynebacterium pseudotuberculosis]|uniref:type I restriction enzyme HsdR N-terminal domain-containing protein n=1 Tax=Corynebacterium pseudotuberculosis TaxID=1719 RepID=UPI00090981E0|nr:type I restriction enzyme HsdR N-terminal domain-containing protein [Corynebacterium pseudotuberculosis]APG82385.1 Type I restriction enzyme R protein [Corynebacterium pseudotuberculosis]ASA48331.1 restriction endonuclease [Corynebacterium pseudotuberculosis Cp162]WFP66809.1 type I restriction enzyme HsdR N-terminal domain-containing protein [Corynebacterium pseudotuberculosis]